MVGVQHQFDIHAAIGQIRIGLGSFDKGDVGQVLGVGGLAGHGQKIVDDIFGDDVADRRRRAC